MKDSEDSSKKGDLIMFICVLTKYPKMSPLELSWYVETISFCLCGI